MAGSGPSVRQGTRRQGPGRWSPLTRGLRGPFLDELVASASASWGCCSPARCVAGRRGSVPWRPREIPSPEPASAHTHNVPRRHHRLCLDSSPDLSFAHPSRANPPPSSLSPLGLIRFIIFLPFHPANGACILIFLLLHFHSLFSASFLDALVVKSTPLPVHRLTTKSTENNRSSTARASCTGFLGIWRYTQSSKRSTVDVVRGPSRFGDLPRPSQSSLSVIVEEYFSCNIGILVFLFFVCCT